MFPGALPAAAAGHPGESGDVVSGLRVVAPSGGGQPGGDVVGVEEFPPAVERCGLRKRVGRRGAAFAPHGNDGALDLREGGNVRKGHAQGFCFVHLRLLTTSTLSLTVRGDVSCEVLITGVISVLWPLLGRAAIASFCSYEGILRSCDGGGEPRIGGSVSRRRSAAIREQRKRTC